MATEVFLFTDIEGSTRRWATAADAMRGALAVHDEVLVSMFHAHAGDVFKHTGDGVIARFPSAPAAVSAAVDAQPALACATWTGTDPLLVRMAIHAGEAERRRDDWFGPALNRCARLLGIGHGGQILLSGAAHALCVDGLPAGISTSDLGVHRLRDLLNPEHVWQVAAAGLASSFPPLRSLDERVGNLPTQLTPFFGRATELAELPKAITVHRLVTLVGAGGMGKTRLALQAAADAADMFADGAWLVELAPLQSADAIDHAVMVALRLDPRLGMSAANGPSGREREAMSPRQAVLTALRDRHAAIVLDNCEHLRSGAAALARELLSHCPHVSILATSREALRLPGEQLWPIDPLDIATTAVDLLVDRATAVKRGFALGDEQLATAVEICRRLDGMPLAIELAASRLRTMTLSELAARLDQRFRLLTSPRSDVGEERHAALKAVVAWSYDLLEPIEQQLLCRLSVFAGSFDLPAVHAVCGSGEDDLATLELLDVLVDRSLLIAEEHYGCTRFRMLETIRQWALAQVGEERARVEAAHASYYAGLAGTFALEHGELLVLETDNLRLAVDHALNAKDAERVLTLVGRLSRHVRVSMRMLEAGKWAKAALALPGADRLPSARSAHILLAGLADTGADIVGMANEARAAIAIETELGLPQSPVPRWLLCIAELWMLHFDEARRCAEEALAFARPDQLTFRLQVLFQLIHVAVYAGGEPDEALLERWRQVAAQATEPVEQFEVNYAEGVIAARSDPVVAARRFDAAAAASDTASLNHVIAGAAKIYAGLMRATTPSDALRSLEPGLAYYRRASVAFGLRRLVRDVTPALCELGEYAAVATIDGLAELPVLRPALVAEALHDARAALGAEAYREAFGLGRSMSDEDVEAFILALLDRHST